MENTRNMYKNTINKIFKKFFKIKFEEIRIRRKRLGKYINEKILKPIAIKHKMFYPGTNKLILPKIIWNKKYKWKI